MFMGYVSLAQWRTGAIGKSRSMGIGGAVSSRRRGDAGRWAIFAKARHHARPTPRRLEQF
jgi:hypothetical protein